MSRLYSNFLHAFRGIRYAAKEPIFRIHCAIGFVALVLGFLMRLTPIELMIMLVMVCLVLTLEMINTIIEYMVDLLKPEFHAHAKIIKDLASGSVLVCALVSAALGLMIFLPRCVALFKLLAMRLVT